MRDQNEILIRAVLEPLLGKPAWCVKQGWGSSLTFEFGTPHLKIREPVRAPPTDNSGAISRLQRRMINVKGQWHVWLVMCAWKITLDALEIAHSESDRSIIATAADEINGRILVGIDLDLKRSSSIFRFETGLVLETWSLAADDHQWKVFEETGNVFTYRGDSAYSYHPKTTKPDDTTWKVCEQLSLLEIH